MAFQQAFQQAVLMSCQDSSLSAHPDERQFSFTTQYRKCHATMSWTIDDFSIRDTNEEKLDVEFAAGEGAEETRWRLQCFFGSCNDDHKDFLCLTLDLVSPGPERNAGIEISLVTPDGRKPCFKRVKCTVFRPNTESHRSGIHSKVTRSYLSENAAQLVPGDKLTIQCKLSVFGATMTAQESKGGAKPPLPELTTSKLGLDLKKLITPDLERTHSDVTLSVMGQVFPAHKAVLSARSGVFSSMFGHDMKEQSSNIVEIEDIEPLVMESFLHYIYTGEISGVLDVQFSKDLLAAADKYEIEELKQYCEVFMSKNLSVENVSYIMVLAHLHGCTELKSHAMEFFATSASKIMDCPDWESVASAHPALVNEALRAMARRHSSDANETPKKKIKFSP